MAHNQMSWFKNTREKKQFWGCLKPEKDASSQQAKLHPRADMFVGSGEQNSREAADVCGTWTREYNLLFKRYTYWWSCTLCCWRETSHCTLTKLYKLIFLFSTIPPTMRNKTYWSTLCLLLVSFKSTNPRFVHVEKISQHFHDPQTSWALTKSCQHLVSGFM